MRVKIHWPTDRPAQAVWSQDGERRRLGLATRDPATVEQRRATLELKLAAGHSVRTLADLIGDRITESGEITYDEFLTAYEIGLQELRERSRTEALGRLGIARRCARAHLLKDFASHESLMAIRAGFLRITKSKHTAKSRMASVLAALNWAKAHGMLEHVPSVPPIRTAKLNAMKGRPLEPDELAAYLKALRDEVGPTRADSWAFLAQGLVAQCLRLGEGMMLHWTDRKYIVPILAGADSVLCIPPAMQKNNTRDEIPITRAFHDLLDTVSVSSRAGFVFDPLPLRPLRWIREPRTVSRTFSAAGERAKIVTVPEDGKYASAHDLRRTGIQQLADMGTPPDLLQRVARHSSLTTTERYYLRRKAQKDTARLWELDTEGRTRQEKKSP